MKLIFDKSSFLSRLEGDEQLAAEIIAMFLSECPKLLADVRAAAEQRNAPALERATHKLKGSVAEICALQAARAARILEELAREGKIQDVGAALEKLEAALQRLMQELHDLRM